MAGLTNKQQVFVEEYLRCWNATEAARIANYAYPNVEGSKNLSNPSIQEVIRARIAEKAMSADEVLVRLADHGRGSLGDVTTFVTERRPTRILKPLADIIADLKAEMLFEEEFAARAGYTDEERQKHDAHMASLERRILRYELRLKRDPDATDEVAGPVEVVQVPVVDLAKAARLGKMHLLKSYNAKDNKVEMYDAQAALVHIGRHHGLFLDKTALTDPTGTKEYADTTLEALRERLIARLAAQPAEDGTGDVSAQPDASRDEGAAL